MRRILPGLLLAFITLGLTAAARADTTLDLSVTGTASLAPDATAASLIARATGDTVAEAQARLNEMVASALREAQGVKALTVTTAAYDVSPVYPKQTSWEARQEMNLALPAAPESAGAKPMLALIGRLQSSGLMLESLTGTLSASARKQTETAAIDDAVKRLRAQAESVAKALGDQLGGITSLRLNTGQTILPRIGARMAMAASPAIRTAPVSEDVTLSGTVTLQPPDSSK